MSYQLAASVRSEFKAAFKTADGLEMKIYGHVDQNILLIDTALATFYYAKLL